MTDFERMRERKDAAILRQYDEWEGIAGEWVFKTALALLVLLCAGRDIVAEVDRIELEKMRKKKFQHSKEMREFARGLAEHAERCIVDVYRETGRGASLDAKDGDCK